VTRAPSTRSARRQSGSRHIFVGKRDWRHKSAELLFPITTRHSRAMGTVLPCFLATVAWMVPCGSDVAT
jgi:hypothetical protein